MKKHKDSHLDHHLTGAQIDHVMAQFAERSGFFIETVTLPLALGVVPCGLHGPAVGDPPVPDAECAHAPRNGRAWSSRLCERPARPTSLVTIIAGPHEGEQIVYTMFGGPPAPQEVGDPGCANVATSTAFWAEHALTRESASPSRSERDPA